MAQKHATMATTTNSRPSLLSLQVLLLSFLSLISCSNATPQQAHVHLHRRATYTNHAPVLNESRHDEEFFTFLSRPDIEFAPRWDIEVHDATQVSPGLWLIAPYATFVGNEPGTAWTAPFIYNSDGELVWFGGHMVGSWTVSDFRVSNIRGERMLTFISHQNGKAYLVDETYNIRKEIDLTNGGEERVNGHEFAVVDDGTRAIHFVNPSDFATKEDSATIDYDGQCYVRFHGFRELDTQSWEPTFEWKERGHISLNESYAADIDDTDKECANSPGHGSGWDATHVNAMDKFPDGDFLVSSRRAFTLYKISHIDGSIVWRLGGKESDFEADTAWTGQHGARVWSQNETHIILSFFDNARYHHSIPATHDTSRALFLALHITEQPMRAEAILSIDQPDGAYNMARGNVDVLPNDNIWVCWVRACLVGEYDSSGKMLMRAELKADLSSYRSYKAEWTGRPSAPPDVHAAAEARDWKVSMVIHVSWNGATEVRRWRLWRSNAAGQLLERMALERRQGFETVMHADDFAEYVIVEALDSEGTSLGHSDVVKTIVSHEISDLAAAAEEKWQVEHPSSDNNDAAADSTAQSTFHHIVDIFHDSVAQFICGGIVGLAILAAAAWIVSRRTTWRPKVPWWKREEKGEYKPVSDEIEETAPLNRLS